MASESNGPSEEVTVKSCQVKIHISHSTCKSTMAYCKFHVSSHCLADCCEFEVVDAGMPVFLIYPCLALVLALKMGLGPTISIDKRGLCLGPCLPISEAKMGSMDSYINASAMLT